MTHTTFTLEVAPRIPARLRRLEELASDLFYSWDRRVRALFARLDGELWRACGHNPKVFLRRVSQQALDEAAQDRGYLEEYSRALSGYDSYLQAQASPRVTTHLDVNTDLVAYFCAEYGLHESLPIYSGGLGILAGDHCKAASDLGLPFVAVGLLYRQGYFTQAIDGHGQQQALYRPNQIDDLPVTLVLDEAGSAMRVQVELPGRVVGLQIWRAKVGHIDLYLLDSDLPENSESDRALTYQLYGGDREWRIQQEIVLGIGGVRALRALGLAPTAWHINEGHATFQILERCREKVAQGLPFAAALECVAANTVFTTHTPVPAGHDIFEEALFDRYFTAFAPTLGVGLDALRALGYSPQNHGSFNMTAAALRGSRFHNGVSKIHGDVASVMEQYIWPDIPPEENPVTHVTNGVHASTFLAQEWSNLLDVRFADWRGSLTDCEWWECIRSVPDHRFWSLRQELKTLLLQVARRRLTLQHRRAGVSDAQLRRITQYLNTDNGDVLVLGFGRRFATYKRATLLFQDPARLARLLGDPQRPVLIMFAGKAHPSDKPGQELIRQIHEFSMRPEFIGRILLLENYDLNLARRLVSGVDVWLNNPIYPLEASGTSGMKAAMNGVLNLSVLDGWWAEGYDGSNGWGIVPHGADFDPAYRDHQEANDLYDLLERQVVPLYFERDGHSHSPRWVDMAKASMVTILPRFNAERQVLDYVEKLYAPARNHRRRIDAVADGAASLAAWKRRVGELWTGVGFAPPAADAVASSGRLLPFGEAVDVQVVLRLNGLKPEDVMVECLLGEPQDDGNLVVRETLPLTPEGSLPGGEVRYRLALRPPRTGLQQYRIRAYPFHELLAHRFELGCMRWL
ncbi:MAG: alpha-glucan family phosphorylase [Pseudomonadota bacterium]